MIQRDNHGNEIEADGFVTITNGTHTSHHPAQLMLETLKAYGVDLMRIPEDPLIQLPLHTEEPGILVETFVENSAGEPIITKNELATGFKFYPEPKDRD